MMRYKVIFLDRDGVINVDKNYIYRIKDFIFSKNLFEILKYLLSLEYKLVIITNQSGIGRGYFSEHDLDKLHLWMLKSLKKNNINILDVIHCPHVPENNCDCRKPKNGMIIDAQTRHNIDLENSWMIGDKLSDVQTGLKNNILIESRYVKNLPIDKNIFLIKDLLQIKDIIIK